MRTDRYLESLLAHSELILWEADPATLRMSYVSPRAATLLGWSPGEWREEGFLARNLHPDDREPVLVAIREVAATGEGRSIDHRLRCAKGGIWWFRCELGRIGAPDAATVSGVLVNISPLKAAEDQLRASEERLRRVIDSAPVVLFTADHEGRFTSAAGSGLSRFGTAARDVVGRSMFERFPQTRGYLARILAGEEFVTHGEERGRVFEVHWAPLRNRHDPVGILGVAVDVTARARAEQQRAEALAREQAARAAAERATQGLAFLTEAGRELASSLDYETTLQRVASLAVPFLADFCLFDVVADARLTLRRVAVAHRDPAKASLIRGLEQRVPVAELFRTRQAHRWLVPDVSAMAPEQIEREYGPGAVARLTLLGELGARATLILPLLARDQPLGLLTLGSCEMGRVYDAPDTATAEALARRCAVALDNARLYKEAREAIRARDTFLQVASHELRTPLASLQLSIQSLLKLARRGWTQVSTEVVQRALGVAERQSRRLARLVGDLLDISRIAGGRLELVTERCDLGGLVRETVADLCEETGDRCANLTIAAREGVVGQWDASRLQQVVTNLVGNALKYGAGKPITVSVDRQDSVARLVVEDHGIGIAPDKQALIFAPFERAVSARNYGGLGLGLYVTRSIVVAHGGHIEFRSEPGAGSTFTVTLPMATRAGERSVAPTSYPLPAERGGDRH